MKGGVYIPIAKRLSIVWLTFNYVVMVFLRQPDHGWWGKEVNCTVLVGRRKQVQGFWTSTVVVMDCVADRVSYAATNWAVK